MLIGCGTEVATSANACSWPADLSQGNKLPAHLVAVTWINIIGAETTGKVIWGPFKLVNALRNINGCSSLH